MLEEDIISDTSGTRAYLPLNTGQTTSATGEKQTPWVRWSIVVASIDRVIDHPWPRVILVAVGDPHTHFRYR